MPLVADPPVLTAKPAASAERELIVVARRSVAPAAFGLKESVMEAGFLPLPSHDDTPTLRRIFPRRRRSRAGSLVPGMLTTVSEDREFYRVVAPEPQLDRIADRLRKSGDIITTYLKPPAFPAVLNTMAPLPGDASDETTDFQADQLYLNDPPVGIGAARAWAIPGGDGRGVSAIDVEYAWLFSHEGLNHHTKGVVRGQPSPLLGYRNHGTAVVGVIGAKRNGRGVCGIAPGADLSAVATGDGLGSAEAIVQAADLLKPGDVLVIELHRPGPRYGFSMRDDQKGYIPVEWWPDDFEAVRYATSQGVVVVAAAGNGAQDLDDAIYDTNPGDTQWGSFPSDWTNPFRRQTADCGAVLVGAGAPSRNTRKWGQPRSRLEFSNYGGCVDAQGWGREVTTTGYGDRQGGPDEERWYTDLFAGTSSATPIVAGALMCVQGVLDARGQTRLTSLKARSLLRSTGTPQEAEVGRPVTQRIGNLPHMHDLITAALAGGVPMPLTVVAAKSKKVPPAAARKKPARKKPARKKSSKRAPVRGKRKQERKTTKKKKKGR